VDLKDKLQNQCTFNMSRLSLFQQDDVILIQDVTDRKRLQRRLREQEERFRHITQSALDAIISIDDAGIVVFWNRAAERMFQYSASEIEGTPVTNIMPAPYREAHRLGVQRIGKTRAPHFVGKTLEVEGLRKDGATFPIEISLSTWQMEEAHYFTGILRDITERKRAEDALRASEEQLQLILASTGEGSKVKSRSSATLASARRQS